MTIPNSVTTIDSDAFNGCSSLNDASIGKGVSSIGTRAFDGCNNLRTVTINSDSIVNTTSYTADSNVSNIFGSQVREYIIGNSVNGIGAYAFNKTKLSSVKIGSGVKTIGESAFNNCGFLSTVSFAAIEHTVTSIGNSAFYTCASLKSVVIPASVKEIGDMAFFGCSSLAEILCYATIAPDLL